MGDVGDRRGSGEGHGQVVGHELVEAQGPVVGGGGGSCESAPARVSEPLAVYQMDPSDIFSAWYGKDGPQNYSRWTNPGFHDLASQIEKDHRSRAWLSLKRGRNGKSV